MEAGLPTGHTHLSVVPLSGQRLDLSHTSLLLLPRALPVSLWWVQARPLQSFMLPSPDPSLLSTSVWPHALPGLTGSTRPSSSAAEGAGGGEAANEAGRCCLSTAAAQPLQNGQQVARARYRVQDPRGSESLKLGGSRPRGPRGSFPHTTCVQNPCCSAHQRHAKRAAVAVAWRGW